MHNQAFFGADFWEQAVRDRELAREEHRKGIIRGMEKMPKHKVDRIGHPLKVGDRVAFADVMPSPVMVYHNSVPSPVALAAKLHIGDLVWFDEHGRAVIDWHDTLVARKTSETLFVGSEAQEGDDCVSGD